MIETGKHPGLVINRGSPFVYVFDFVGYDFSAATFRATFREYPDALGDPLIVLEGAAPNAEGISVSIGVEDVLDDDGNVIGSQPVSSVQFRINETTTETILPPASGVQAIGSDVVLYWGLHVTASGLGKIRWVEGPATIHAGDQG